MNMDEKGRIRIDDLEMRDDVQKEVYDIWRKINSENIIELSDLQGYRKSFFKLFGFEVDGVNYEEETEPSLPINGLIE